MNPKTCNSALPRYPLPPTEQPQVQASMPSRRQPLKQRLGSLALLLCGLGAWATPAWAEGSRSWYPSTATGHRASLYQTGSPPGSATLLGGSLQTRSIFRVYAQAGEYILLGSTATGLGGTSNIRVFNPGLVTGTIGQETVPGSPSFSCNAQRTSTGNTLLGDINSRAEELAGPDTITNATNGARGNAITNSYVPCYYQAPSTGIYSVIFDPVNTTTAAVGDLGDINMASANYFNVNQGNHISAWDVTVRSSLTSTVDLNGRMFFYYTYVRHGTNPRFANFSVYPVTLDGYRYQIDLRSLDPNAFIVYGNQSGFFDPDGVTPLYHDILGSDDALTTITGGATIQRPQFPMFFTPPTSNPQLNTILTTLGIPSTPTAPAISSFVFTGNTTNNTGSIFSTGGTFTYTANVDHSYDIVISRDGVNFDPSNANNRHLRGLKSSGTGLSVTWDGKDNVGTNFPVGNYSVQLFIKAGEYHFPLVDAENSPNGGPSSTLLNAPGSCISGNCSTAFYDDRAYTLSNGTIVGTYSGGVPQVLPGNGPPATATSGSSGFNSTTTQRTFGNGSSTGWGDRKGLDFWTYFPSTTLSAPLQVYQADFGDAPDTYGTDATAGNSSNSSDPVGALHFIVSGIRLGAIAPDGELNAQTPLNGTGDGADEDGVSSFNPLTTTTTTYSVNVTVANDPGGNGASGEPSATLTGWIDFDRDGIFQADEAATVTVPDGATTATLTWNNIGSSGPNINLGATYARFRLTTDSSITPSTPGGSAINGEVEDYALSITQGNPNLNANFCQAGSTDLMFILDDSSSVDDTEVQQQRDAVMNTLTYFASNGIPARASIVAFDSVGRPVITSLGVGTYLNVTTANLPLFQAALNNAYGVPGSGTNWEAGFQAARAVVTTTSIEPDVVFFFTDGTNTSGGSPDDDAAQFKANGAHIYGIGIDGVNAPGLDIDDFRGVTDGTNTAAFNGSNTPQADYLEVTNYSTLNTQLTGLVSTLCPTSSTPNLILVKRITKINNSTTSLSGDNLAAYKNEAANPYDDNVLESATPPDTDKWPNTTGNTSSTFLIGGTNGGQAKPGDEVEYTIYFLSTGISPAHSAQLCDRVPSFQTFVPNAFSSDPDAPSGGVGASRGILVQYNGQTLSYTNDADGDTAAFYPPGTTLPAVCGGVLTNNPTGAVVVNLGTGATSNGSTNLGGTVPNATAPGTPATSFGFVRFRAKVN